jgi:SPP1 gp7 family putative phage head morphogenesis protein
MTPARLVRIRALSALAVATGFEVRRLRPLAVADRGFAGTVLDIMEDSGNAIRKRSKKGAVLASFDRTNAEAVRWARSRSAQLVTEVTTETRAGIREVIANAFTEGLAPRESARLVRDLVGLTKRDAKAVAHLRAQLTERGVLPAAIEKKAGQYAAKLHRARAEMIARTETMASATAGQAELWRQAEEDGLLSGDELREWIVTDDDRLCELCASMDGEQVGKGELFSAGVDMPPAHPGCRCSWGLAEPRGQREAA